MNRLFTVSAVVAVILAGLLVGTPSHAQTGTSPIASGKPAPPFTVTTLDGKSWSLAAFQGKTVLLDFGAVNCPPCRIEMPQLQRLHRKYKAKGLVLFGLLEMKPTVKESRKMLIERGVTYPVAIDAGEKIFAQYRLAAHPTTVLIDATGKIARIETGYIKGDEKALEAAIVTLLAAKGNGK